MTGQGSARYREALRCAQEAAAEGRSREAIDHIKEATRLDGRRPEAWVARGRVLLQLGQSQEALQAFETALEHAPRDIAALRGKAYALEDAGRLPEAQALHERAAELEAMAWPEAALARVAEPVAAPRPPRVTPTPHVVGPAPAAHPVREVAPHHRGTPARRAGAGTASDEVARDGATQDAGRPEGAEEPQGPRSAQGAARPGRRPAEDVLAPARGTATAPEAAAGARAAAAARESRRVELERLVAQGEQARAAGELDRAAAAFHSAALGYAGEGALHVALDACLRALEARPGAIDVHFTMAHLYLSQGWASLGVERVKLIDHRLDIDADPRRRAALQALAHDFAALHPALADLASARA